MARKKRAATPRSFNLRDALNGILGKGTGYRSVSFVFPFQPLPAPRPRFTRQGIAYFPKPYQLYKADAAIHVPELVPILETPVAVSLDFVCPPYKTVSTPWPKSDIDNYAKTVLDVITKTGRIWKDDIQVVFSVERKCFTKGDETPHTAIYIREV